MAAAESVMIMYLAKYGISAISEHHAGSAAKRNISEYIWQR
jgi:hypothetical protein